MCLARQAGLKVKLGGSQKKPIFRSVVCLTKQVGFKV